MEEPYQSIITPGVEYWVLNITILAGRIQTQNHSKYRFIPTHTEQSMDVGKLNNNLHKGPAIFLFCKLF